MTVGKEYNTVDTIKTRVMRQAAHYLASMWKQTIYPIRYEDTFLIDNVKIRVSVGDAEHEDDALKRLRDIANERSQDA